MHTSIQRIYNCDHSGVVCFIGIANIHPNSRCIIVLIVLFGVGLLLVIWKPTVECNVTTHSLREILEYTFVRCHHPYHSNAAEARLFR